MDEVPPFYLPVLSYQNRLVTNPVYQLIRVSQARKNPFVVVVSFLAGQKGS